MELPKEHVRQRCIDVLEAAGLPADFCHFYADVIQCEYDITHTVYRIHKELQQVHQRPQDVALVASTIQSVSKSFILWKRLLDDLTKRRPSIPSIQLDPLKLEQTRSLRALCCLQTNEVELTEGERVTITDVSKPNRVKIRNAKGDEGYIPALSCLLPSPDGSAFDAVDRLQIYLVMCWSDCDNKLKSCLRDALTLSTADLWNLWMKHMKEESHGGRWEDRVNRRLKRLVDTTANELNNGLECSRLHKTLTSVENELISRHDIGDLSATIDVIVNLDKAVLSYQWFSRHWRLFRHQIKESPVRPIRLVLHWNHDVTKEPNRKFRYYEVRLTCEETTVREEMVHVPAALSDLKTKEEQHEKILQASSSADGKFPDGDERQSSSRFEVIESTTTCQTKTSTSVTDGTSPEKEVDDETQTFSESTEETIHGFEDRHDLLLHSASTGSERIEERSKFDAVDQTSSQQVAAAEATTVLIGGSRKQSTDAEQLTVTSHEENCRIFIRSVVDPRDGRCVSFDEAVSAGIIDRHAGLYINPTTGVTCPIAAAMDDGRIQVDHVTTTRTPETIQALGLITIRTQTVTQEYSVTGAVDVATGRTLTTEEARQRGILDDSCGLFLNTETGQQTTIDDAVEAGLVLAQFDDTREPASQPPSCDVTTYAVSAVVDQIRRRAVPFGEAVRRGLIDRQTGSYVNNLTGERVFAGDAIRRGFFKSSVVTDPTSLVGIDSANRVVIDRMDRVRKNIIREVHVVSAFRACGRSTGGGGRAEETSEDR
jgi:hypothetical protein